MVDTARKQLPGNVTEFVKDWLLNEFTGDENGLGSGERTNVLMRMSRSSRIVRALSSVKRSFLSVEERQFRMYETGVLVAVEDCYIG